MPQVEQLFIFLASPGDVPRERNYVEEVVEEVNRTVAHPRKIVLTVKRWEKDTFAEYGNDPQALVNAQIADMKQYALFVGIMWNRLGTPTKNALSGTVEEFDRAVTTRRRTRPARPTIMFFFRDAPFEPKRQDELDQKAKVLAFKQKVQHGGLTASYKTPLQFKDAFRSQLIMWLNRHIAEKPSTSGSTTRKNPPSAARVTPSSKSSGPPLVVAPPVEKAPITSSVKRKAATALDGRTAVLLNDKLYRSQSVSVRADLSLVLKLLPQNASEKAALNALRPEQYQQGKQVSFAYQDDGATCRVTSVETESTNGKTVYIIMLTPDDRRSSGFSDFGTISGMSVDQLATIRARLLLLDEQPSGNSSGGMFSMSHWMTDSDSPVKFNAGLFPSLWTKYQSEPKLFGVHARLAAVYSLRASHTVEHVLDLKLGPIRNGSFSVHFRGERRSSQSGQSPVNVEVDGVCVIEKKSPPH